jgi:radical SAM-linked protein
MRQVEPGKRAEQDSSPSDRIAAEQVFPHAAVPYFRYRIEFGKEGPLRYCSHLDLMRVWERVLRRAAMPLVYSQGFNPRPKLQIAAGLPLGYSSTCEVLDVWLEVELPELQAVLSLLQHMSPPGLIVRSIKSVDLRSPALQTLTRLASYQVILADSHVDRALLEGRLKAMLSQAEVVRERRGKTYNLRPLIDEIELMPGEPVTLRMVLALSSEHGTGRPDEVLYALGLDPLSARVTRMAIQFVAP